LRIASSHPNSCSNSSRVGIFGAAATRTALKPFAYRIAAMQASL
jgi:hypothetical protein